jgi:tryptophan halogenase
MDQAYESIRDFITMHYYASNRDEPFWRAARSPSVQSDTLKQNLELWRHRLPDPDDIAAGLLVTEFSYSICLASKGYFKGMDVVRRAAPPRATWEGYRKMLESKLAEVPKLPTAREFLREVHGETQPQDPYKVYDKPPRAEVRAPVPPS